MNTVAADVAAHSGGRNLKLHLARPTVSRQAADSGGGTVDSGT